MSRPIGRQAYSMGRPGECALLYRKQRAIQQAVNDLVISKTFDNGMHYCSEQTLLWIRISPTRSRLLENMGGYFPGRKEIRKLENLAAAGDNAS